ncbi:MAG: hypothetical protein J6P87_08135 [Lachnospiraceae bacterium]|nr:hypothetical protein [Lachnospiraceae bacterium]
MNDERSPVLIGVSSLLVIFSVLCLAVFAMLSLSTVQTDKKLITRTVEAVSARAAADVKAQMTLAGLREGLGQAAGEAAGVTDLRQEGNIWHYSCPVSDGRRLCVSVEIGSAGGAAGTDEADKGRDYRILRWQEEIIKDWVPDEDLDLWQGSGPDEGRQ